MIQDHGREADVPGLALDALQELAAANGGDDISFTPAFLPAMQAVLVGGTALSAHAPCWFAIACLVCGQERFGPAQGCVDFVPAWCPHSCKHGMQVCLAWLVLLLHSVFKPAQTPPPFRSLP
jgi:hypothetical protein